MTASVLPISRPQPQEQPVLSIRNLTLATGARNLVEDLSLEVTPASIHAVVGESGSGKTLTARAAVKLLPPGISITSGSICLAGQNIVPLSEKQMEAIRGKDAGFVFQEPMLSLNPALRVGEQMAEGLRRHLRLGEDEIRACCIEMLERVSLRDPEGALRRYPHEFSGGMRQRIMLASVMALRPSLLIADEPTTALDAIIQRDVLDIMTELSRDMAVSVLLITHDLGLVGQYADEVTIMRRGHCVEAGPSSEVIRSPRSDYARALLAACPKRMPRPPVAAAAPLLRVEDLSVRYQIPAKWPWQRPVPFEAVSGVSLDIRPGETVAIVGESGSGKSTMGRAVLGLRAIHSGRVVFDGAPVNPADATAMRALRRDMQVVFQDPASSLDPRMRVADLVSEGLRLDGRISAATRRERAITALSEVALGEEFADRHPHELSGGQRQRVAIARAIVLHPRLIVADEAVSALDVTVQAQVLALLDGLQKKHGFAYLFITHDLGVVEQIADRVVVMKSGRVVETAPRDRLFDTPFHDYTCRLLSASAELTENGSGHFEVQRRQVSPRPVPHNAAPRHGGLVEVAPDHLVLPDNTWSQQ
ncbi:ABC transporter ATP-binding protein [Rhizobium pusense]|uniref:dipeptide ABC transporter ATP-binding protein n=1 Tax=Agrobacterium pusense TaxID=648995 RepID=UPI001FCE224C|nr:ABC transporter ATP-binding protein [Agrobacterium pusense]MCJ2877578.1 ABC transporter ATP-binding protein [Agrobacterium pusense]